MIENTKVQELAESLASAPRKDRERTLAVVELAYDAGKLDGAIDALGRLMAKPEQPA